MARLCPRTLPPVPPGLKTFAKILVQIYNRKTRLFFSTKTLVNVLVCTFQRHQLDSNWNKSNFRKFSRFFCIFLSLILIYFDTERKVQLKTCGCFETKTNIVPSRLRLSFTCQSRCPYIPGMSYHAKHTMFPYMETSYHTKKPFQVLVMTLMFAYKIIVWIA